MPVSNKSEIPDRWEKATQGKSGKWEDNTKATRGAVLSGLTKIGFSPGSQFSAAVNDTSRIKGDVWASRTQGKGAKLLANLERAISR